MGGGGAWMHRGGSRYWNPRRGPRDTDVTKRRKPRCSSALKESIACRAPFTELAAVWCKCSQTLSD